jgi:hypothetical protein
MGSLAFFNQLNKRLPVEYSADGVSHFLHRYSNTTGAFVRAIWAWTVRTLADAIDWRERTIGHSNDAANGNFARWFTQGIAATLTACKSVTARFGYNRLNLCNLRIFPSSESGLRSGNGLPSMRCRARLVW